MLSENARTVSEKAKQFYQEKLRTPLESTDHGRYVCIEPESGDYFVGDTLDEAVNQAIDAYPDRLTYTLRIGYQAAIHIGAMNR